MGDIAGVVAPLTAAGVGLIEIRVLPADESLLDLRFLELDVLAGDGIVFLESKLFGFGASVLLGDVEIAGVGGRQELDLERGGLGHIV
jgi:hypothetical protein